MAKTKRLYTKPKPKQGRKVKLTRQSFSLDIKSKARAWKVEDGMKPGAIRKKLKDEYNLDVPRSTLSTWWNAETMARVGNIASDRFNVQDTRYNPKQRPDVMVDMEKILTRKVIAIKLTGLPYTREIVQILAIHIFHKLVGYNLYNKHGQRKNPDIELDEEIIHAVEHAQLATQF